MNATRRGSPGGHPRLETAAAIQATLLLVLLNLVAGCRTSPPTEAPSALEQSAALAAASAQRHDSQGNHAAAAARWQDAADAYALLNRLAHQAIALHNLAQAQRHLGNPSHALTALERAAALNRHLRLDHEWWRNQVALLQIEVGSGDLDSASARLETLQPREDAIADPETRAAWNNEVGQCELGLGRLESAFARFVAAEREGGRARNMDPVLRATALANQGRALELLGRTREALPRWEKALELFQEAGQPMGVATAMAGLGRGWLALEENRSEAAFLLRQAAENFERLGDHSSARRTLALIPAQ